jgi:PAS domain S-box-containing protein
VSSRPSRGAARLAAILDALPDALLIVNCNGTVVNANAIALETFEAPGTALVGRGLLDLLPTFDSRRIPGSMRRADEQLGARTRPTRMIARRTDGVEFQVEVTSANLEDGRTPYAQPDHFTGDELLMLVVRDLTNTLDSEAELARERQQAEQLRLASEAELARQQRQTEMILRAAAEGVVGVDTEGKVVLVNPSAAQILGYRASDLGGKELHPLIQHSRADGTPLPLEESPLTDTLRSGLKHRVRSVVLWRKDGTSVPVDLTTAPVRDGDQLVGAVMTFTDRTQLDALARRNDHLQAVLGTSLRGPLEELRRELGGLAADPAGQLWPEANQILHHLAAGYSRMTTLIDNVVAFQKLEAGTERLNEQVVGLNDVVAAGVEGAVELIGPGRAQYAVHAPPIEVTLDGERMSQALAHLIADTIGVDATGTAGTGDSTIVVAAAQRGDVARIEVRGPQNGGHPVHLPLARGIVERHGGVLQVHEVPGQGSAYVVEVPIDGSGGGAAGRGGGAAAGAPAGGTAGGSAGKTGSHAKSGSHAKTGSHAGGPRAGGPGAGAVPGLGAGSGAVAGPGAGGGSGSGAGELERVGAHRPPRQRQAPPESALALPAGPASGKLTPVAAPALPAAAGGQAEAVPQPTGRRRALHKAPEARPMPELPAAGGAGANGVPVQNGVPGVNGLPGPSGAGADVAGPNAAGANGVAGPNGVPAPGFAGAEHGRADAGEAPTGRRARRALPQAGEAQPPFPASVQLQPTPLPPSQVQGSPLQAAQLPPAPLPVERGLAQAPELPGQPGLPAQALPGQPGRPGQPVPGQSLQGQSLQGQSLPGQAQPGVQSHRQPQGHPANGSTAGGGVPFAQAGEASAGGQNVLVPAPSGRRRKLAAPEERREAAAARLRETQQEQGADAGPAGQGAGFPVSFEKQAPFPGQEGQAAHAPAPAAGVQPRIPAQSRPQLGAAPGGERFSDSAQEEGQAFTIGAPAEGAEGPEHLDEVTSLAEPDDPDVRNPRRLLVWPEPDASTHRALTERGYDPVIVRSREEVAEQVGGAANGHGPAALFVDPLTGPITRTALQSLRTAAISAEVPVLVTAGLGQATREAAYGADPAVLLKALAPRDSEQHPSRVLLVEGHQEIAAAFTATLERRGMQVAHAGSDADAAALAEQVQPNLVVMDLMLIRRRRVGIVDWLRGNGRLNRTPLVVYTSVDIDPAELPRLRSGETVLFLAERSTSTEVQARIVDLLGKIGTRTPPGRG